MKKTKLQNLTLDFLSLHKNKEHPVYTKLILPAGFKFIKLPPLLVTFTFCIGSIFAKNGKFNPY